MKNNQYYQVQLKVSGHYDNSKYDYCYNIRHLIEVCTNNRIYMITLYDENDKPIKSYKSLKEVLKEVRND